MVHLSLSYKGMGSGEESSESEENGLNWIGLDSLTDLFTQSHRCSLGRLHTEPRSIPSSSLFSLTGSGMPKCIILVRTSTALRLSRFKPLSKSRVKALKALLFLHQCLKMFFPLLQSTWNLFIFQVSTRQRDLMHLLLTCSGQRPEILRLFNTVIPAGY